MYFVAGLTFSSGNRFYKKLVDTIEFDYNYWEAKCRGNMILFLSFLNVIVNYCLFSFNIQTHNNSKQIWL